MLLKSIINYTNPINIYKILPKRCSALFINGPKATENFVFLVPHVDYQERLKDKQLLQTMIIKRKSNYDIQKLEKLWEVYEYLKKVKLEQDLKKLELSKQLTDLFKIKKEGNDIEKLKIQIGLLKENLKNLKVPLWSAEEAAVVEFLKLPNLLHSLTPASENNVIFSYGTMPTKKKNHYIIGHKKNLLKFMRIDNYYLTGEAAMFELGAKFYFSDVLKRNSFIQFSNPDFVKSLVVEGCGIEHTDPASTYILRHTENTTINEDKRIHLTGAGSLCSFLAYHAKTVVYSKVLPLKYFSVGRQYTPSKGNHSLFEVNQSSVVQIFAVAKDNEDIDKILCNTIEMLKQSYKKLNYHFRLSYVSADKLNMWESLRVAIEMFSPSLNKYVEIGHVSLSGDFISKRLMFTYTDSKQSKFPHILSGTILNIPKFLACVLEQDEEFSIPDDFKVDNWTQKVNVGTL